MTESFHTLARLSRAFVRDEGGAEAIEYGLVAALIFLVILGAVAAMAINAVAMWQNIGNHMV
jgi:pilus assembly protein Flp/PilA